ncbi:MAG: hypothetical protein E7F47_00695 [Peptoniphilus harei]|nr:hypothetical protein [Peptoniphilus harei]MDU5184193.1 hypothetical protein [Peptoniphilus harei]
MITRVEVDKKGKYYKIRDEGRELLEEEVERLQRDIFSPGTFI